MDFFSSNPAFVITIFLLVVLASRLMATLLKVSYIPVLALAAFALSGSGILDPSRAVIPELTSLAEVFVFFLAGAGLKLHRPPRASMPSFAAPVLSVSVTAIAGGSVALVLGILSGRGIAETPGYLKAALVLAAAFLLKNADDGTEGTRSGERTRTRDLFAAQTGTHAFETARTATSLLGIACFAAAMLSTDFADLHAALAFALMVLTAGIYRFTAARVYKSITGTGTMGILYTFSVLAFCSAAAAVSGVPAGLPAFAIGVIVGRTTPAGGAFRQKLAGLGEIFAVPVIVFSFGLSVSPEAVAARPLTAVAVAFSLLAVSVLQAAFFSRSEYQASGFPLLLSRFLPAASVAFAVLAYARNEDLVGGATCAGFLFAYLAEAVISRIRANAPSRAAKPRHVDPSRNDERILVAVSNPETVKPLIELAYAFTDEASREPIYPVSVASDDPGEEDVLRAEDALARSIAAGNATGIPVVPSIVPASTPDEGIERAARERRAGFILLGWNKPPRPTDSVFDTITERLIRSTSCMFGAARYPAALGTARSIVLVIPKLAETHPGFDRALRAVAAIALKTRGRILVISGGAGSEAMTAKLARLPATQRFVHAESWKELPDLAGKHSGDKPFFLTLLSRQGSEGWHPTSERIPAIISEAFPESGICVIYMPEAAEEDQRHGAMDDSPALSAKARAYEGWPPIVAAAISGGRVIPLMKEAALVDAIRVLVERSFPAEKRAASKLAAMFADTARKQPIELAPGVVLLHAHIDGVESPLVMIGVRPEGWRLMAVHEAVRIVIILCSPAQAEPQEHLQALTAIASALGEGGLAEALLESNAASVFS